MDEKVSISDDALDPRGLPKRFDFEGVITGMTRDGTFRIRDGKIAEPLVNLRFMVSVPQMLEDVPGLGRERQLVNSSDFYGERYPVGVLVPAIATARFNITGVGSEPGL